MVVQEAGSQIAAQDGGPQADSGSIQDSNITDASALRDVAELDGSFIARDGGNRPGKLCSGSAAIDFYAVMMIGAGTVVSGSQVMFENGYYVVIEKDCTFWAYEAQGGHAVTGALTSAQRQDLEAMLPLDEFSKFAATMYEDPGCSDGPERIYSYAGQRVVIQMDCGNVPGLPTGVAKLESWFTSVLNELESAGTIWGGRAWDGAVRFSLVNEDLSILPQSTKDLNYRNAPAWPLASDPLQLSVTIGAANDLQPGDGHSATGTDAAALRKIRDEHLAGKIGFKDMDFAPIEQPDSGLYQLRVRDSIPLENDRGLLPFNSP